MAVPTVGKKIPMFSVATTAAENVSNKDLAGAPYVLYFYPKDDTPGCTLEGKDFRDQHGNFKRLQVRILGVSRDSLASHEKFRNKYELPFELVADTDDLDAMIGPLWGEADEEKRIAGWKAVDKYIAENAYVIPLIQYQQPILFKNR